MSRLRDLPQGAATFALEAEVAVTDQAVVG
jgi:hypothetical protein